MSTHGATKNIIESVGSLEELIRTSDKAYSVTSKICPVCNNPFYFSNLRQRYCSKSCKDRRYNESERGIARRKTYYQKNAPRIKTHVNKYYYKYPNISRAQKAVHYDLNLKPPTICPRCGSSYYIEAHHPDYSKLLDIQWVCKSCHKKIHAQQRLEKFNPGVTTK